MITVEWIVIITLIVAMYIIINKYEKKMSKLENMVAENRDKIGENQEKIEKNHEKIKTNHNRIEQMWVTIPQSKED